MIKYNISERFIHPVNEPEILTFKKSKETETILELIEPAGLQKSSESPLQDEEINNA